MKAPSHKGLPAAKSFTNYRGNVKSTGSSISKPAEPGNTASAPRSKLKKTAVKKHK